MKRSATIWVVGAALALGMAPMGVVRAQEPASVPAIPQRVVTLRGITALSIAVEGKVPAAPEDGVSAEQIWKDAALRVRLGGVRVLESAEERAATPGAPVLNIAVNVIPGSAGEQAPLVYAISLELRQRCKLEREPGLVTSATTWRTSAVYRGGNLKDGLRSAVRDLADEFLNDYLAANPLPMPASPLSEPETIPKNGVL